jgi:hypothetical protein
MTVSSTTPMSSPTSSSSTSSSSSSTTQTNEVTINGVKIKIASTKKTITNVEAALYPKSNRNNMSPEKLNDLFEKAVSKTQTKYDILNLKIADPDKLEETYDLEMAISRTKAHHIKYDMNDVFTIVKPNADPTKFEFVNLYDNYALLTEREVADSNEWYATMTEGDDNAWFLQNLKLTHEHLSNNVEDSLVTKINETYYTYPVEKRGGPLFFKLMMDLLQNNSQEAAAYLVNVVINLKITDFDGENVDKVISLIRGAINRLENLRTKSGKTAIPDDFTDSIIKVFKTSSVPAFNALFEHFSIAVQLSSFGGSTTTSVAVKDILRFAELQYRKLSSTNEWTGVKTKANQSVFHAPVNKKAEVTCFNCGGKHSLKECTKPRDDAKIKANRKLFWNNKVGNKGNNNKNDTSTKKQGPQSASTTTKSKNAKIVAGVSLMVKIITIIIVTSVGSLWMLQLQHLLLQLFRRTILYPSHMWPHIHHPP